MKNKLYTFLLVISFTSFFSQAVFWTETFSVDPGSCSNKGQLANGLNPSGVGTWTVVNTGVNGVDENQWFISATEAGKGAGMCASGCIDNPALINRTLHIGTDIPGFGLLDLGTYYSSDPGSETNKRVESPIINCTGQSTISLVFLYFVKGVSAQDYFDVQYSPDAGVTWTVINTPAMTTPICPPPSSTPSGSWTPISIPLPTSANNNANVKIGFRWQNDGSSTGVDPAVAIDDVQLKGTAGAATPTFAPTFTIANPLCTNQSYTLTANTGTFSVSGYTWSATPSGPVFGTPNASATTISFPTAATFTVTLSATSGTTTASATNTVVVSTCTTTGLNALSLTDNSYQIFPNPTNDKLFVQGNYSSDLNVEVLDALGKIVTKQKPSFNSDNSTYLVNVSTLPEGVYFIKISSSKEVSMKRFVKQ